MQGFNGFAPGKAEQTRVPNAFFSDLLPLIDDLAELKLTVYLFWALQQRDGDYRYVRLRDLREDAILLRSLAAKPDAAIRQLDNALERATARGTLLHVILSGRDDDHLYFMNTERGRIAVVALENGDWQPGTDVHPIGLIIERPTIFALYEQNIGALTPLIADILRDSEQTYPSEWIVEAMQIAVERNIRNWRYIESILKRWLTEGKNGPVRENSQGNRIAPSVGYEQFWDKDE